MLCFKISCNIQTRFISGADPGFLFPRDGIVELLLINIILRKSPGGEGGLPPHPSRSIRLMYFKRQAFMSFLTINSQCTIIISPCTLFANVVLLHFSAFSNKMMLKLMNFLKKTSSICLMLYRAVF